jgi:hypothetical protein
VYLRVRLRADLAVFLLDFAFLEQNLKTAEVVRLPEVRILSPPQRIAENAAQVGQWLSVAVQNRPMDGNNFMLPR